MNCSDLQKTLERSVELRNRADLVQFEPHLAGCAECRGLVADYCLVETALANWTDDGEVPDLTQRVLEDLTRPRIADVVGGEGVRLRRQFAGRALAAGIVVAVVSFVAIGLFVAPKVLRDGGEVPDGGTSVVSTETDPTVDYESLLTDTRIALGSLMEETDRSLGGLTTLVPRQTGHAVDHSDANTATDEGLAKQLGHDLKPIGNQLRGSFAFLLGE